MATLSKDLAGAAREGATSALDIIAVLAVTALVAWVSRHTGADCALRVNLQNQKRVTQ